MMEEKHVNTLKKNSFECNKITKVDLNLYEDLFKMKLTSFRYFANNLFISLTQIDQNLLVYLQLEYHSLGISPASIKFSIDSLLTWIHQKSFSSILVSNPTIFNPPINFKIHPHNKFLSPIPCNMSTFPYINVFSPMFFKWIMNQFIYNQNVELSPWTEKLKSIAIEVHFIWNLLNVFLPWNFIPVIKFWESLKKGFDDKNRRLNPLQFTPNRLPSQKKTSPFVLNFP